MDDKKTIFILGIIDSGSDTGLGHLKRTHRLIQQLNFPGRNKAVTYLIENDFVARVVIKQKRYYTVNFKDPNSILKKVTSIYKEKRADIIVIDSYKLSQEIIEGIVHACPLAVSLMIDDFNRLKKYKCDFVLNYHPMAQALQYNAEVHTKKLFGFEFFPMSKQMIRLKKKSSLNSNIRNVFITMGGADPCNFTEPVCKTFMSGWEKYIFHILLGPEYRHAKELLKKYLTQTNYRFYRNVSEIAPLIAKTDIAISSAGVTAYELAFFNKPTALIPISNDQLLNVKYLKKYFSFIIIGGGRIPHKNNISKPLKKELTKLVYNKTLRENITKETKKYFYDRASNKLPKILLERLQQKKLRIENPIRLAGIKEITSSYNIALRKNKLHQKVLWASKKGMFNRFKLAKELLAKFKYKTILDIGCGTADLFNVLKDRRRSVKKFACDLNFKMIKFAEQRSGDSIIFINASGESLPFKTGSFDMVTLIGILQNCGHDIHRFMDEISRIIKKRGHVFLVTKNLGWAKFLSNELKPDKEHNWFFDHEISEALTNNGFKIIKKSGFDNKSGRLIDIAKSHEIVFLAQKT